LQKTKDVDVSVKLLLKALDAEGIRYMMDSIIHHRKEENAVPKDDEYVIINGKRNLRITTDGWHFNIQWKDGTTSWEPLRTLKEADLVEIAEYVVDNNIASKPDFAWWVPSTSQKRDRIIAAVHQRMFLNH
jgi:hypothetical protein